MSILAAVSHSASRTGIRVVIGGVEKMGKTTLSCNAPRALLVPLEVGFAGINIYKTPMLEHFDHVMMLLDEIVGQCQAGQFAFQSLVVDSATALERLIHSKVIQSDPAWGKGNNKAITMESALGGYGKAYLRANELFGEFLTKCDQLAVHYGINIILTCHVFAANVVDPAFGEYSQWDILLHSPKNQKTYGKREMLTQWADIVGFLHEPFYVSEGKTMNKAISANQGRILAVTRSPGWVAGNRFGMINSINIPKEGPWNQLAHEIYQASGIDVYNRDV